MLLLLFGGVAGTIPVHRVSALAVYADISTTGAAVIITPLLAQ